MALTTRPLTLADLPALEEIQRLNPTASQWNPIDYLGFRTTVLDSDGEIVAFLCIQLIPPNEAEILNLAVHPTHKRKGLATRLLRELDMPILHLDVRESNRAAIAFYRKHGFQKVGHRRKYYSRPVEDAIMMSRQPGAR